MPRPAISALNWFRAKVTKQNLAAQMQNTHAHREGGRDRRQFQDSGIAGHILAWPLGSHELTCDVSACYYTHGLCFGLSHPKQQYLLNCSFDYKSVWTNLFVLTTDQDLFWLYFDTFFWHVGPTCYACNFVKICHGYNLNTLSSQLWEDTNFGLAINQTIIFVPNLVMLFGYG